MVPVTLPNTGFCAFNSLSADTPWFRVMLDVDRSTKIVKKLKLMGVTYGVFKNTVFIKNMLSGALNVARFNSPMSELFLGLEVGYENLFETRWCI